MTARRRPRRRAGRAYKPPRTRAAGQGDTSKDERLFDAEDHRDLLQMISTGHTCWETSQVLMTVFVLCFFQTDHLGQT